MVIGHGMIASIFEKNYAHHAGFLIFASGVSNSNNTDTLAFEREANLLTQAIKEHPGKHLVYFSTCSIYDPAMQPSAYVSHKLAMEKLVAQSNNPFTIFRISNPIGHTQNKHTVLNYFVHHITQQIPFVVWQHATRNLMDVDDMFAICHHLLLHHPHSHTMVNVANTANIAVPQLVALIENHTGKKGIYQTVDKGSSPVINTQIIAPITQQLGIGFDEGYVQKLLQKYFWQL